MDEKEREVLNSLCNGDITFSEAALLLEVSKAEIEDMLDHYKWIPSSDKIIEFCDIERETLSYIKEISQPIIFRLSHLGSKHLYEQMQFAGTINSKITNCELPMPSVPTQQENVTLNHTEFNGIPYIQ